MLLARDLLSPTVARVDSEGRPVDLTSPGRAAEVTHAAVFDRQRLLGVVDLAEARVTGANRIFADLLPSCDVPLVRDTTPAAKIARMLEESGKGAVGVTGADGALAGVVTRNSLLSAMLEEARRQLDEILEQREHHERLRVLGSVAAGVAHDLNNVLVLIVGNLDLLQAGLGSAEDQQEYLEAAFRAAGDAADVVKRLTSFCGRVPGGEPTAVLEADTLLREVVALTRPKWRDEAVHSGRRLEVTVEADGSPLVRGRLAELRELLVNLVLNAVDAMPRGGRITLRAAAERGRVCLEVADTGTGMTEEQSRRCFEPFFTTKGTAGTGLGLTVCHDIAERHGGSLEVDSEPGRGATFRLCLPATEEAREEEPRDAGGAIPHRSILFIEDQPEVRTVVQSMLESLGQEVEAVPGGSEGLRRFQLRPFDLVITDLTMPDLDGMRVARAVKGIRPEVPVILLTGWAPYAVTEHLRDGPGPDRILEKPVTLEDLAQALQDLA